MVERAPGNVASCLRAPLGGAHHEGRRNAYLVNTMDVDQVGANTDPWQNQGADPWATASSARTQQASVYWGGSSGNYAPINNGVNNNNNGWNNTFSANQNVPAPSGVYLGVDADGDSINGTDTETVSSIGENVYTIDDLDLAPNADSDAIAAAQFWAYQQAKSRWRSYMGKPTRKVRRFVRRKGKGKGKGKTFGKHSYGQYLTSLDDNEVEQVFKGKGKGRFHGKGKRSSGKM